ncbi:hypothetical protein C8R47DRAFT_1076987 [Mycena vitilis]|nr:hypothetical protein C8R47DRAFT_1076987 [Mycena vitilis]
MGAHEQPRSVVRGASEQQYLPRSMPQHRVLSEQPPKSMRERGLCSTSGTDTPAIAPAVADPRLAALHGGGENAVTSLARQLHPIVPLVAAAPCRTKRTLPLLQRTASTGAGLRPCGLRMGLRNVAVGRVECGGIAAIAASLKQAATGRRDDGTGDVFRLLHGSQNRTYLSIGADRCFWRKRAPLPTDDGPEFVVEDDSGVKTAISGGGLNRKEWESPRMM